ncbi:hypothetical protein [Paenibacillus montanisoli]|uniref:Uncharacterized protein n=1 Tax=Paenibacillus montanisoli TaxID=2081970 RepID=A0A328U0J6_9BACL|nr:hypothetical protein [Paenibacillus montanisoli]RAP74375.1 hypothetical protein DL346_20045 [Paenibacillus montanisoli]
MFILLILVALLLFFGATKIGNGILGRCLGIAAVIVLIVVSVSLFKFIKQHWIWTIPVILLLIGLWFLMLYVEAKRKWIKPVKPVKHPHLRFDGLYYDDGKVLRFYPNGILVYESIPFWENPSIENLIQQQKPRLMKRPNGYFLSTRKQTHYTVEGDVIQYSTEAIVEDYVWKGSLQQGTSNLVMVCNIYMDPMIQKYKFYPFNQHK